MTTSRSLRVGLFGGTFDPPHNAHVALARAALEALQLDELRWIPAGAPWQKARAITPAAHREALVRLAIAGERRLVLDRIELERPGPSYTIDTVRAMRAGSTRPSTPRHHCTFQQSSCMGHLRTDILGRRATVAAR